MKPRTMVLIDSIVDYLRDNEAAYLECCGEGDDVNYLPAKKALEEAEELKKLIEKG